MLFEHPVEIIRADDPSDVDRALAALQAGIAKGLHAAGFFSYELGYLLEPKLVHLLPKARSMPLLWFGLYAQPQEMTGAEVQAWLTAEAIGNPTLGALAHTWDSTSYLQRFEEVQNNIRSGDIYQLNLTFKAKFNLQGSPLALYRDLRLKQRVSYGCLVDTGDVTILSASPELFIAQHDRTIETRPMKGTAPRAGTQDGDTDVRHALATDVKSRAENLMIVDLMRNDLGRIADLGSVSVTDLFTVETFKTLHQMTSGVRATLKADVGIVDILKAIFPPGSITGAPKIRAMELIRKLETEARGVYCGAIGRFSPDGNALFNVAIRTAIIARSGSGEMGIGSGVVADSVGSKEYAECLLKMKFLTDPVRRFELIETMLYDPPNGIWLLDEHMKRLQTSALYFGFSYDLERIKTALDDAISNHKSDRLRVRLLLGEDGDVTVTTTPQPLPSSDAVMRYVVSDTRLASSDLFLYHKTTRRDLYDQEWKHFSETLGADEVIYLNENGELAEGSRTTIFLERDGKLETPALEAGLLPGTLRAALLAEGRAVERSLTIDDLNRADAVYLGNSVRGLMRAEPLVPRLSTDSR
ncbi:MAG: aminodeoxychorismate synthase, component I [Hyphomicrobium sp.]|nr:MAG: aminodeoxychorismate synthase, component I [Hyphomicrobium sp.]PPC99456.1 MAG: aminodeoxychorismate synthase, component I [Hyphomicrobium sp.]